MSRSRRPPPLFEVMRQTDPSKVPVAPSAQPPGPRSIAPMTSAIDRTSPRAPVEVRMPETPSSRQPPSRISPSSVVPLPASASSHASNLNQGGSLQSRSPGAAGGTEHRDIDDEMAREGLRRWGVTGSHIAWIGVAVIAALIVVWSVGHWQGREQEKARLLSTVDPGDPPRQVEPDRAAADPLAKPPTSNPGAGKPENSGKQTPAAKPAGAQVAGDPRKPGFNYFTVQQVLHYSTARATAEFMTTNGVPAAAVPMGDKTVDTPQLRANNKPTWKVIVAEGFDSKGYSSPRRPELETKAKTVGMKWARDPKGGFDFSSGFWDKYEP
ncbi:MAG: hypothetical protein H7Y88_09245 [Phycisphaerales bacterium]|nr:hypothetical protein [Phycisphaerales bacterium]